MNGKIHLRNSQFSLPIYLTFKHSKTLKIYNSACRLPIESQITLDYSLIVKESQEVGCMLVATCILSDFTFDSVIKGNENNRISSNHR